MKSFTRWVVARYIKDYQNVNDLKVRSRYGALEGWVSIIINSILFVMKILIGLSIKSVSLIADAVHTLSDSVTSVVIIVGFKMARKPSDREHPFGHGRIEPVAALVVSVLLFVAGVEFLEKSVHSIMHPEVPSASNWIILSIAGTTIVKELLSRFSFELGSIVDSKALKADALHHRSDVIATGLVVVALIGSRFGYNRIDGIMGLVVSFIVCYSGYAIAREAISPLLGEAPSREMIEEIGNIARRYEGVLDTHDIVYHRYGSTTIVSLHIEVPDNEPASKLHTLSEEIEGEIARKTGGMVIVHIDPINKSHPEYRVIEQAVKEIIAADKRVHSFHDLRIAGCEVDRCKIIFDIALEEDVDEQERYDVVNSIQEKLRSRFPKMKTAIEAEPKYAYNL